MTGTAFAFALLLAVFAQAAAAGGPQAAVDGLIAADRSFSRIASERSLGAALAAMLDEEVVMPLPGARFARGRADALNAVNAGGRAFSTRAEWVPVRGGVSADGRHGFTWGYLTTISADGTARPGKYVAYWVRRPAGWRAAAWRRVPRPEGAVSAELLAPALPVQLVAPRAAVPPEAARSLAAAERAFSDEAQRRGLGPAFARWGSADAANIGRGPAFTIGAAAIGADMPQDAPSPVRWGPDEGVVVASSGDLGFTFGWIRPNGPVPEGQPAAMPFFTVWRRAAPGAPWRYVAE